MNYQVKGCWSVWLLITIGDLCAGSANTSKESSVLDNLMRVYDKRFRPNFGGVPTEIRASLLIISIVPIDEVTMEFTTVFYLRQEWVDQRLAYGNLLPQPSLSFTGNFVDKFWLPDTFFESDMNDHVPRVEKLLTIYRNGNIFLSLRKKVRSYCPMEFYDFPLDEQTCEIALESYAYTVRDAIYVWKHGNTDSLLLSKRLKIPQYTLIRRQLSSRINLYLAGNFSSLVAEFVVKRKVGFHIIETYLPSALIVVISWVAFWIDERSVPARITLAITTVLAITTLFFGVQSSLPKVGHVKAIDIFLFGNFFFVFGALIEYAVICYLTKRNARGNYKKKESADFNEGSSNCKQTNARPAKLTLRFPGFQDMQHDKRVDEALKYDVIQLNDDRLPSPKLHKRFSVDERARVLFPAAYIIFLVVYAWVYVGRM